jgi:hypothetical protein
MPRACHGWAETVAAYRLLDHPAMGEQERLSGHQRATRARLRAQDVVVLGPDTTCLDDGTTPPKQGMGTVKSHVREASLRHPTVALTPERLHRGGLERKVWPRPEPPVAQARHRHPRAAQARDRWREGSPRACEGQPRGPETRVVTVAERAGDLHAWWLEARRRAPGARAECISRAQCQRRIAHGPAPRDVGEARQKARTAGASTGEVTRQPPRPPRQATLSVAATRVLCSEARRLGGQRPPVAVVAV